ncbi:MAG: hypothetical protein H7Y61_00405 [Rhizobiales bacterium]|nr:hypothetical protein [Rhizobacter sp.]
MNTTRLVLAELCAATALIASSAFAATPAADTQSRYEQERARCLAGQSGQARETCLKEAGAARDAAKKGQLNDGDGKLNKNAKDRCDVLTGDEQRDCMARIKGAGNTTESGSVKGGGIIRETKTIEVAPAASTAPSR